MEPVKDNMGLDSLCLMGYLKKNIYLFVEPVDI